MKGNNTLEVNQDTMVEAVQRYLDEEFATGKAPQVLSIKSKDAFLNTFVVEIKEKESAMGPEPTYYDTPDRIHT